MDTPSLVAAVQAGTVPMWLAKLGGLSMLVLVIIDVLKDRLKKWIPEDKKTSYVILAAIGVGALLGWIIPGTGIEAGINAGIAAVLGGAGRGATKNGNGKTNGNTPVTPISPVKPIE